MNAHDSRVRGSATHRHAPARACSGLRTLAAAIALGCTVQLTACGGDASEAIGQSQPRQAHQDVARTMSVLPNELWDANGRTASKGLRPRHATREQLATEELVAAPYTLVIDADDDAAVESGLQLAETAHTFAGGKALLGVFVRSRHPALAARLAERLSFEQGWDHVFVVD